ncbi:hypothetical protein SPFM15_00151 [Salmonella phage SPFM15]|nr:hypothetical protein SPFM5_00146 [Salmonella phage SPFM5]VFR13775.1 hypothetical protein SPFM15_00151 [Salmonella phage SPFM15]
MRNVRYTLHKEAAMDFKWEQYAFHERSVG